MSKERPILFSAAMVRAILEGRKTVTRRAIKVQPRSKADIGSYGVGQPFIRHPDIANANPECPYGRPGDRLWVRESLRYDCEYGHYFAAGGRDGEEVYLCWLFDDDEAQTGYSYDGLMPERSIPSIHLHRRYSRILLEVTDVRVERLQTISDKEIESEGIDMDALADGQDRYDMCHAGSGAVGRPTVRTAWRELWELINGPGAWDANPWVWCVKFRRIEP